MSADALTIKSFTDSLFSPFACSFKLLRSLEDEEKRNEEIDAKLGLIVTVISKIRTKSTYIL